MPVVKVIEVLADSKDGWEAAANVAVNEARKSIKNIKSVYIRNLRAMIEDNEIVSYRINAKISFEVESK